MKNYVKLFLFIFFGFSSFYFLEPDIILFECECYLPGIL